MCRTFRVLSGGWKTENVSQVSGTGSAATVTYSSGTMYKTDTNSTKCPEVYPDMYSASMIGGTIYLDGLFGPVADGFVNGATAITTLTETPNAANQVCGQLNYPVHTKFLLSFDCFKYPIPVSYCLILFISSIP